MSTTTATPTSTIPTITETQNIVFTKDHIQALDFSPLLQILGTDILPEGPALARMMGKYNFRVIGFKKSYVETDRIRQVQYFFYELNRVWPHWFYFCDLQEASLISVLMSITNISSWLREGGRFHIEFTGQTEEKFALVNQGLDDLAAIMTRAGFTQLQIYRRIHEISQYYEMPFERDLSDWGRELDPGWFRYPSN